MSWLLGGGKKKEEPTEASSDSTVAQTLGFDPSTVQDVNSFLSQSVDFEKLHPLAGVGKELEYLDLEDDGLSTLQGSEGIIPSRGWTDDLCYGTGTVYLLGLGIGGAYGLSEGLSAIQANQPARLKINTVLNSITRRGPFVGNSAGVCAMIYNLVCSSIDGFLGYHSDWNSIGAGLISGAIFRSTRGLRPMFISSAVIGTVAAGWCGLKRLVISTRDQ